MYKKYYVVKVVDVADRDTEEGKQAWDDATTHHCIPFVKDGCYLLERFWMGYSGDPYENLEAAIEDYGNDWSYQGMLPKVIADHILKTIPDFADWGSVMLDFRW